jgi:para-nitrobenzyl esterase
VFDHLGQDPRPWSAYDRQLAARLADTWASFARTGTPNGQGLPDWPAFDGRPATILRIGDAADLQARGKLPDFSLFGQPPKR